MSHHASDHHTKRFEQATDWVPVFDDPQRDTWQKPAEVLDALDLRPTSLVADLGAGTGYFAMRMASRVPQGRVFAVDIEPDMVRYLAERARREQMPNVTSVPSTADEARLPEPVDRILVVDTYHHIPDRVAYFTRLRASLRPGGRLAIVDFTPEASMGPPAAHRLSPDQVTRELGAAGFQLRQTHRFLPQQYYLVFEVSP